MSLNVTPVTEGFLDAGNHRVKWYRYGSQKGVPTLFLHGGPGSGFDPGYAELFDLEKTDLIAFDQRGSGKSEPAGSMENNTTQLLISDIEALRKQMGITKWIVTGHSWGATLALLYAQAHPEAVKAVTICGLFLAREQDYAWSFDGAKQFFADNLETLRQALGAKAIGMPLVDKALAILANGTLQEKLDAVFALSVYNAPFCRLVPKTYTRDDITEASVRSINIMLSYYKTSFDVRENQICEDVGRLANIPVTIVHGRLDMDCPVAQAFAFKEAYPKTNLIVVQASHSLSENPLQSTYRQAIADTQTAV